MATRDVPVLAEYEPASAKTEAVFGGERMAVDQGEEQAPVAKAQFPAADAVAELARALAESNARLGETLAAALARTDAPGPQVAPRKVRKTVVRDENNRIKYVDEEEID